MRILITGAAGTIGRSLRATLRQPGRTLRLFDVAPMAEAEGPLEEVVPGDLRSPEQVRAAVAGCDAVVHLAGIPVEDTFERILETNIVGTRTLLEACRTEGCRRVVFASSNHAIGFFPVPPQGGPVAMEEAARPDTNYGFSKASGELLCRLYFDRFGIEACCIRIGTFGERPQAPRQLRTLITPRDLAQLVERALGAPDLGFLVVAGQSGNRERWWAEGPAAGLGYAPQDDAWDLADDALRAQAAETERFSGGPYPEAPLGVPMHRS
ncbi:MAG: NAD-dependent epimerase/dehydratase family protein [Candidatus Dormibacteraceae bacterium]